MRFVYSEYVEQCSFVWTVSRLSRCTIGYVTGVFETQVVTLILVVPLQLISFALFSEEWVHVLPSFVVLYYCTVFPPNGSGYMSIPRLSFSVFLPNVYLLF